MNRRPALLSAAAMAAVAALSLSACGGGGDDSKDSDKIAGADNGASTSASPSPKASDDGVDRPEIRLPKDVKNIFEGRKTGDAKKDAVLADNERRIESVDEAITGEAKGYPALKFYSAGDALLSAAKYVEGYRKDGKSFVGTTRYFNRQVTFLKGGAAAVTYCMDDTQTYPKDRKTGKVDRSSGDAPATAKDYIFYNTRLEKNDSGVWQTTRVFSEKAAKECA
ncbi:MULTISPECIES: hypothetical protein [Streptomyces]|nr:hypothetical protein [Streptomyces venezuelae]